MADIPNYDHDAIETKWQKRWAETKAFAAKDAPDPKKKFYVLEMFPYPSGNLHMGHVRNYAIGDLIARFHRLRGKEVLHPMGWDALGLPAENAALKDGILPAIRTAQNIANVKRQFQRLGISYDWDREIGTHTPEYYRWNQWFFIKMLERGIIYRRESEVNWCEKDQTILANEQVVDGRCWRCDSIVEKRKMPEWAFKITAYAQRLLDGIETLVAGGWPDRVTTMQRNWIGKSVGVECDFPVHSSSEKIRVFTTRADTIFGATYVVLAPEHPMVAKITAPAKKAEVDAFIAKMKATDKIARTAEGAEKLGVDTGAKARNPFTNELVPVWLANFVLADYGTGAVMSVPAHDQRDFEFAKKYSLPVKVVIAPAQGEPPAVDSMKVATTEDGVLVASGEFSGLASAEAREKIGAMAERGGFGQRTTKWHIRDWGFSRQRYWGTPIPILYCEKDGMLLVREQDLPVRIPEVETLTYGGGAPLAKIPSFVNTTCWKCGGPARRDVETMDTFVDSTWYFARFLDPKNDKEPFARAKADAWLPVDIYIGGPEHAVLHLLYFRFWTMVMQELGLCATTEPATRLLTQGMVVANAYICPDHRYVAKEDLADGKCPKCGAAVKVEMMKMGKSFLNGVSPDEMVAKFGADTARLFSLFAAPPEKDLEWDDNGIIGCYRFLKRVWTLVQEKKDAVAKAPAPDPSMAAAGTPKAHAAWRLAHATVQHVTDAIGERFHYNTAVAKMMELTNALYEVPPAELEQPQGRAAVRFAIERLVQVMNPYAPHLAAELWELLGNGDIAKAGWPAFDPKALETDTFNIGVQVNGKVRGEVTLPKDATEDQARAAAIADPKIKPWVEGKTLTRVIYKPPRTLNLVVKE